MPPMTKNAACPRAALMDGGCVRVAEVRLISTADDDQPRKEWMCRVGTNRTEQCAHFAAPCSPQAGNSKGSRLSADQAGYGPAFGSAPGGLKGAPTWLRTIDARIDDLDAADKSHALQGGDPISNWRDIVLLVWQAAVHDHLVNVITAKLVADLWSC